MGHGTYKNMHFSFLEKFGAAALICAWLIYGVNGIGNMLFHVEEHVSMLPGREAPEAATAAAAAPAEPEVDFATLLASADPDAGEKAFGKCKACHSIEAGGANKVGPNLHNVVGADIGAHAGFAYSDALTGREGNWTYDDLDQFLENPKGWAPGTKMNFAGLSKPKDRAEVIAYLRANTESPPPLPEPAAKPEQPEATGEGESAPAEGESGETAAPGEQAAAEAGEAGAAPAAAAGGAGLAGMIAAADPADGEKVFRKCQACHSAEKDGPNKVGPHLWDVVGRPMAAVEDFKYSDALKGMSGEWTDESLDQYLENPKAAVPGTKMTFAGLSKPEDRAAVIAYLRAHGDNPPPLQ